jgi:hypothetical protein
LLNNTTSFDAALAHPELAPVLLELPESYGKLPQNFVSSNFLTADFIIGTDLSNGYLRRF